MLAQGRAVIPKPDSPWSATPLRATPCSPSSFFFFFFPTLEWAQPAVFAAQTHFWQVDRQAHPLPTPLPYSPHIMGQEGPCQPHPNHQEEADKDEAGLQSWRGSERGDSEDRGQGEAPSLWGDGVRSNPGGPRKGGWEPRTRSRERSWSSAKGSLCEC